MPIVTENIYVNFHWKRPSTKKWLPGTQQVFEHYQFEHNGGNARLNVVA